jgi:hypothetical protein
MRPGDRVVFAKHTYLPPLTPHYDEYKGHVFEVVSFHYNNTHVQLQDEDDEVKVKGYVHREDIRFADDCQVCHGKWGGIKGNENVIDGIIMCDYCSTTHGPRGPRRK